MSSIALPFQLTKTLACALSELQAVGKVDPTYLLNSSINHKYNNQGSVLPIQPPRIAFFGIGVKGYRNLDDDNLSAPYIPPAKNLDLYSPIPIRIVPVENDLSASEREMYRMRVLKTVDGRDYWAYYLKKLTIVDNRVRIIQTDLTSGEETDLEGFNPDDLTPIPTTTSAEGTVESTTKVSVALSANVQITGAEVLEYVNVMQGGNLLRANVSEIGIYTGNDQTVAMSDGLGGTFNGTESIYTQLAYHYCSLGSNFASPSKIENILIRLSSASAFLL